MGEVPGGGEDGENTAGLSNFTLPTPFSTGCSSLGAEITPNLGVCPWSTCCEPLGGSVQVHLEQHFVHDLLQVGHEHHLSSRESVF